MLLRTLLAALTATFIIANPAQAHSVKVGALSITDLWTRATPPKAPTAAGYLTIENAGAEPDRLTGVTSPFAGSATIHEMSTKDGTMIMRPVEAGVEIPAGGTIALAPGGFHIMFMDLKEAFVEGAKVAVTLTFEKAGNIETFLHVLSLGARGPEGDHPHDAMEHGSGQ
jgi:hypothetical protein